MALEGVSSQLQQFIPDISFSGIFSALTILLIIVLLIVATIAIGYFIIQRRKYNKKINIFEKIHGRWSHTGTDKAMEVKSGKKGDTGFILKKHKKYIPIPTLQMGPRIYWIAIREDGEWINFDIEDIDIKQRRAGVHFVNTDMRYARTALEEALKDRYDKPNLWKEYGVLIASVGFIAMIGIMTWLLFDRWIELAATTNAGVEASKEVIILAKETLTAIDNIRMAGCG